MIHIETFQGLDKEEGNAFGNKGDPTNLKEAHLTSLSFSGFVSGFSCQPSASFFFSPCKELIRF